METEISFKDVALANFSCSLELSDLLKSDLSLIILLLLLELPRVESLRFGFLELSVTDCVPTNKFELSLTYLELIDKEGKRLLLLLVLILEWEF